MESDFWSNWISTKIASYDFCHTNIQSSFSPLKSSKVTSYNPNYPGDDTKSMIFTTNYQQFNDYGQISKISQTQSDGSTIITKYKYPSDYSTDCYSLSVTGCQQIALAAYDQCKSDALAGCTSICPNDPNQSYCINNCLQKEYPYKRCSNTFDVSYANFTTLENPVICDMNDRNMIEKVLEKQTLIAKGTTNYLTGGELNIYNTYNSDPSQIYLGETKVIRSTTPSTNTTQLNLQSYNPLYNSYIVYDAYDSYGNLLQYHKTNDINVSYIWGYNNTLPIAEAKNASKDETYYTSFEESSILQNDWWAPSWTYISLCNKMYHLGRSSLFLPISGNSWVCKGFNSPAVAANKNYKFSGWAKVMSNVSLNPKVEVYHNSLATDYYTTPVTGNTTAWQYFEITFNTGTDFKGFMVYLGNYGVTDVYYDDIRVYPADAQMTSYTYDPLIGMTSQTDAKNFSTHYKYDALGRLAVVTDKDNNILKQYQYHYAGGSDATVDNTAPSACSDPVTSGPDFTFSPSTCIQYGENATFTVTDPVYDTYDWDFGDGSVHSQNPSSATHAYSSLIPAQSSQPSANVTLTITGGNNPNNTFKNHTIPLPRVHISSIVNNTDNTSNFYVETDQLSIYAETPAGSVSNELYDVYFCEKDKLDNGNFSPLLLTDVNDNNNPKQVTAAGALSGPSTTINLKLTNLYSLFSNNTNTSYDYVLILRNQIDAYNAPNVFSYKVITLIKGSRPGSGNNGNNNNNGCSTNCVTGTGQFSCCITGSNGQLSINDILVNGTSIINQSSPYTIHPADVLEIAFTADGFTPYYYFIDNGTSQTTHMLTSETDYHLETKSTPTIQVYFNSFVTTNEPYLFKIQDLNNTISVKSSVVLIFSSQ